MKTPIIFKRSFIAAILLIIMAVTVAKAQYNDIQFERLNMLDGLSHNAVGNILMDQKGFLWFGTFDGLNRYDGYKITVYKNKRLETNSLGANRISALFEDSKGRIWVGTRGGGLNLYDYKNDNFKIYSTENGKSLKQKPLSNNIRSITEDKNGNLWLATSHGVDRFNPENETFHHFVHNPDDPKSLNSNDVRSIYADAKGAIFIGTDKGRLNHFDYQFQNFKQIPLANVNSNPVLVIYQDSEDNLWVGTELNGLYKINLKTNRKTHYINNPADLNSISKNSVRDICEDKNGAMWIATDGGGLNILPPNSSRFIKYRNDISNLNSLSNDAVFSVYKDAFNNFWIGTGRGGINIYKPNKKRFGHKKHHSRQNSLIYNNVLKMVSDKENNIWIGTDGGGMNKYIPSRNRFIPYVASQNSGKSINGNAVTAMCFASDNHLYIGCYGKGLNIYNPITGTFAYFKHDPEDSLSISDGNIRIIYEDISENIWIGKEFNGLNLFNKTDGTFKRYTHDPNNPSSIADNYIVDIIEDKAGFLWVATQGGGLNMLDRHKLIFQNFKHDERDTSTLSGNYVRSLHIDQSDRLWVGTDETGLNLYNPQNKSFRTFTENHGLPNNSILAILEDKQNRLWLSTNKGLSCFDPKTNKFRNFDVTDGLQGNQFLYNSATKGTDGYFYFGGINGFNVFHPDSIHENMYKPKVFISNLRIFNEDIEVGEEVNNRVVLEKNILLTKEIYLTHNENVFSLEFVGIDYFSPDKNQYQYMLEGFDDTWTRTNALHRVASYTNLNPGDYTFKVKASNSDGLWNTELASLTIHIVPPFWKTWWFYTLLGILIIALIFSFIKYRVRKLGEDKSNLEKLVSERTEELSMQKDEMQKQKEEIMRRAEIDRIQNWMNKGWAFFSDILSKEKNDIVKLSGIIIKELIKFLEAGQGAICLINDKDSENITLDLVASYALDTERYKKKSFMLREGLTGACYTEQKTILVTNVPDDYMKIHSGLGIAKPNAILLVPLKLEKIIFGIIEIASFKEFTPHKIEFVEKLAQNITSALYVVKMNSETSTLLEQSQLQAEQLKSQEEFMRQNLEVMQTTQEDFARREIDMLRENQSLKEEVENLTKQNQDNN